MIRRMLMKLLVKRCFIRIYVNIFKAKIANVFCKRIDIILLRYTCFTITLERHEPEKKTHHSRLTHSCMHENFPGTLKAVNAMAFKIEKLREEYFLLQLPRE